MFGKLQANPFYIYILWQGHILFPENVLLIFSAVSRIRYNDRSKTSCEVFWKNYLVVSAKHQFKFALSSRGTFNT